MLGYDDVEIETAGTGREALDRITPAALPTACVLDLTAARHDRASKCSNELARTQALSEVPVVVFTGRELSAEEDARLHTMARSIVVKGVESPERLLDETALFLHRVVTGLAAGEAAHAGAADHVPMRTWWAGPCCWSTTTPATSSR